MLWLSSLFKGSCIYISCDKFEYIDWFTLIIKNNNKEIYFLILQYKMQNIHQQTQLIINGLQLGCYSVVCLISIFKVVNAIKNKMTFLTKFFICVMIITIIQIVIQALYIAELIKNVELRIYKFLIINLYAIFMQSLAIFLLSDYWYQTRQILTKSSSQVQLKQKNHFIRYTILALWFIVYCAFIGYGIQTNTFADENQIFDYVLSLGCQGIGVSIMIWAIILQVYRGYTLQIAVSRYNSWLSSISLKTIQFKCLYYISTILNILRILFLIAITILVDIYGEQITWLFLFVYIYTATNIVVLIVYLFGFSLDQSQNNDNNQTLLTTNQTSKQEDFKKQRGQTQLSNSSAFSQSKD